MADETPEIIPIKRRGRRKKATVDYVDCATASNKHLYQSGAGLVDVESAVALASENEAAAVRPKRMRKRAANPNREIIKTMRRLGLATSGLGPSAPEIFKAATLQCVQAKLEEIQKMLSWIAPIGPGPALTLREYGEKRSAEIAAELAPKHQLTPEEADALYAKKAPKEPGQVCQFCGKPATYITKRKVPLCIVHQAQGVEDDQGDVVAERMRLSGIGFGMGTPDVIRVPQNVIDDALARGDGGEGD